jgi:tetratricopeptide (TPR) repeat protein
VPGANAPHDAFEEARAAFRAGRVAEARTLCDALLARTPDAVDALNLLGIILAQDNQHSAAAARFEHASTLAPARADILGNHGIALRDLGRHEQALDVFNRALSLTPDDAMLHQHRGWVLRGLSRHAEALHAFEEALRHAPEAVEVLCACAQGHGEMGRFGEALRLGEQALRIAPGHVPAMSLCANALGRLQRHEEALALFERALAIAPDNADLHSNRGVVLCAMRAHGAARDAFSEALALSPDHAIAASNIAPYYLLEGDFERGWRYFEQRWANVAEMGLPRDPGAPLWRGEPLRPGQRILIHCEQGMGDTLQFCRYVPLLAARGVEVIFETPRPLYPLLRQWQGAAIRVLVSGDPLPAVDLHCPLMSLPHAFATRLDTIPGGTPYLVCDPALLTTWSQRLGPQTRPRIGITWSGNPRQSNNHNRSIALARLLPLTRRHDAEWFSLQKEMPAADRVLLATAAHVRDLGSELRDFADTAALAQWMDLIITVDTSVAHLAGALARPVWIMLAHHADWRYLRDRDDCPWYPTARLFRQPEADAWEAVVDNVSRALAGGVAPGHAVIAPHESPASSRELTVGAADLEPVRAALRDNDLVRAEHLVQAVLETAPDAVDALNLLGVIRARRGAAAEAVGVLERATRLANHRADVWGNLGNVLHDLGRLDEALQALERATLNAPRDAQAHHLKSIVLRDMGRLSEALACMEHAQSLAPRNHALLVDRGLILLGLQRPAEALACLDLAARAQPDSALIHDSRGLALRALARSDEALASFERAASLQADFINALNHAGSLLCELRRANEALAWFDRALGMQPDNVEVLNNRGHALRELGRPDEALEHFRRALVLDPRHGDAEYNCGVALMDLSRPREALHHFERVMQAAPRHENAHWNASHCHLKLGNLPEGWRLFEWRWTATCLAEARLTFSFPLWLGKEDPTGKTILLHAEQGFGDTIQFCRYASLVAQRGATVVLAAPAPLLRLLAGLEGVSRLIDLAQAPIEKADFHCPLMSLPLALGTTLDTIPGPHRYLNSPLFARQYWETRLGEKRRLRVGLVWSGGLRHNQPEVWNVSGRRNIPIRQLETLAEVDAEFISLQKGEPAQSDPQRMIEDGWRGPDIREFASDLRDFSDTAALIDNLDLVISVCTSTGHLAAALGKPVWILACYDACWRWLMDTDSSPWYPSVKLYRQQTLGGWEEVMTRVVTDLRMLAQTVVAGAPLSRAAPADATIDQARACFRSSQWREAEHLCDTLLAANPHDIDALNLLAIIAVRTQREARALALLERGSEFAPHHAGVWGNLGTVLHDLGRQDDALAALDRAIALDNNDPRSHHLRGAILLNARRDADALAAFERALHIAPEHEEALAGRGFALRNLGRLEEALHAIEQALEQHPRAALFHTHHGNLLCEMQRHAESLRDYEQALSLEPGNNPALVNLGGALHTLWRSAEALPYLERALAQDPNDIDALYNLGMVLADLDRRGEALALYERLLHIAPSHVKGRWNRALFQLQAGDFEQGWAGYELRWQEEQLRPFVRNFPQPLWLGESALKGKTMLLHCEAGLGDSIQFCRYAPLVARQDCRVLLEAPAPLLPLLQDRLAGVEVFASGSPLPAFDLHCPLMSLPLAFGTRLDSIPAEVPYLGSDPVRLESWRQRLGGKTHPRVGLVWSGNPRHKNDHNRSIPLALLSALLDIPDIEWFSLHKEVREADLTTLASRADLRHFGEELLDFGDTAALTALMDLVITVDSSVAHLAGAMGKPVWLLLPFNPDWRWLLERSDSPWYPTARLFRQPRHGEWPLVVNELAEAVRQFRNATPHVDASTAADTDTASTTGRALNRPALYLLILAVSLAAIYLLSR